MVSRSAFASTIRSVVAIATAVGCADRQPVVDGAAQAAVAGANDHYSCITTSRPGCDFSIGIGNSLEGAGECKPVEDFEVKTRNQDTARPLILAIHGGGIELGTDDLAMHLADRLGWDYYVFEAHRKSEPCKENLWMHVTSTRFNSATALEMAESHPSAVSLHGYREDDRDRLPPSTDVICVGGLNSAARTAFIATLYEAALVIDGNAVLAYDATIPREPAADYCKGLRGTEPDNIANRGTEHGLQLEMPRHLRSRIATRPDVRDRIADAIAGALEIHALLGP